MQTKRKGKKDKEEENPQGGKNGRNSFNDMDVARLGLMPGQVKFVSLGVPFLSQLVHVRCVFPIKLELIKNDTNGKVVNMRSD